MQGQNGSPWVVKGSRHAMTLEVSRIMLPLARCVLFISSGLDGLATLSLFLLFFFFNLLNKDENAYLTGFGQECYWMFYLLEYGRHIMHLVFLPKAHQVRPLQNVAGRSSGHIYGPSYLTVSCCLSSEEGNEYNPDVSVWTGRLLMAVLTLLLLDGWDAY